MAHRTQQRTQQALQQMRSAPPSLQQQGLASFFQGTAQTQVKVGPQPLFPELMHPPVQIKLDQEPEALRVALRASQRLVRKCYQSPYRLRTRTKKTGIERYSDMFIYHETPCSLNEAPIALHLLPEELKTVLGKVNVSTKKQKQIDKVSVLSKLALLAQQGDDQPPAAQDEEEVAAGSQEEEDENAEEMEEEPEEEETDYNLTYFDNGEEEMDMTGAGGDDDEGPVF